MEHPLDWWENRLVKVGKHVGWALIVVGAGLAFVAGIAFAGFTPTSRSAARTLATTLIGETVLPPGAVASVTDPAVDAQLRHPFEDPDTPDLADLHRFWRVPGDLSNVIAWIRAHRPAGSNARGGGMSASRSGVVESAYVTFSFPGSATPTGILGPLTPVWLVEAVAKATGGGTALRADAEVVWLKLRPASERIPLGVKLVTATLRGLGGGTITQRTVTTQWKVLKVEGIVNGLLLAQPGLEACPDDVGPYFDLAFRSSVNAAPLAEAVADGSGCGLVTFRIRGRSQPALIGGPKLVRQLSSLLGLG